MTPSSGTLGYLIDNGYRVVMHCTETGCSYWKWLNLDKLVGRLGQDHGCLHADLAPQLWCLRCDSRAVGITVHPPAPDPGQAHSMG